MRSATMNLAAIVVPLVLSAVFLVTYQFAQPPSDLKPKVFVIGLSKTGTTSVGDALALLGYKRNGWKDIRSRHLVHTFIHGDKQPLIDQSKHFDAFEDLPWSFLYREMAEMYPDANFILSLRKDEKTWLKSLRRHMSRGTWEPALFFYGAHQVDGHEDVMLDAYRNHTANVREYFRDQPERYGELVIDDGDANWKTLCRLAQCPQGAIPVVGFPKSNTAAHWKDGSIVSLPSRLWLTTLTKLEDWTSELYYECQWSVVNTLLEWIWYVISVAELACCNVYHQVAVKSQAPLPVS